VEFISVKADCRKLPAASKSSSLGAVDVAGAEALVGEEVVPFDSKAGAEAAGPSIDWGHAHAVHRQIHAQINPTVLMASSLPAAWGGDWRYCPPGWIVRVCV
jgi:hypothetical protein